MPRSKPLVDSTGEVRNLTIKDLRALEPMQALPASLRRKIGTRGPQKAPTKERITIRLSRDVVERFRATGEGWQTRVDAALQDWLKRHKSAA
ncbi:MAG: BrnA antitoxin family protein [Burkholderiales bacterium]|nr:BrnA antitoxin family protein [Burkholderiales bacterium]MDE2455503.1 BrnA antitoxin family protein [Burkholderiales bacterium]